MDPSSEEEEEPTRTGIMGLHGEANSQAKDASGKKALPEEAPCAYHTQAYDDSRGITGGKEKLAIGQQQTNQTWGKNGRMLCPEVPHEKSGQRKAGGGHSHPEYLRDAQQHEGEECDNEGIWPAGSHRALWHAGAAGYLTVFPASVPVDHFQFGNAVRIVMLYQAA